MNKLSILIIILLTGSLLGCDRKEKVEENKIPGIYFFSHRIYYEVIRIFENKTYEHLYMKNGEVVFRNKGSWNLPSDDGRGIIFEPYTLGHDPTENSELRDGRQVLSLSSDIYFYKGCVYIPFHPDYDFAFEKCE